MRASARACARAASRAARASLYGAHAITIGAASLGTRAHSIFALSFITSRAPSSAARGGAKQHRISGAHQRIAAAARWHRHAPLTPSCAALSRRHHRNLFAAAKATKNKGGNGGISISGGSIGVEKA